MLKRFIEAASEFINANKLSGVIIAFISFIIVALFSITNIYDYFEFQFYDFRFRAKSSIEQWDRLTFVDIDDSSLSSIGKFPWPRDQYAVATETLSSVGATLLALDIIFPDESAREINPHVLNALKEKVAEGAPIYKEEFDAIVKNNDSIFAQGVKKFGKVILPYAFKFDPLSYDEKLKRSEKRFKIAEKIFIKRSSIAVPKKELNLYKKISIPDSASIYYPIPEIMSSAKSFGFVDRDNDLDGTIRRIRLVRFYKGRLFFNLSLSILFDICNVEMKNVEVNPGENIILKNAFNPVSQEFENIKIPIDDNGMMFINWAGPGPRKDSFSILPFYSLIEYGDFVDEITEFFDKMETQQNKFDRSKLYEQLDKVSLNYSMAKTGKERRTFIKKIKEINSKIRNIEYGYGDFKRESIKKLEAKLAKSKKKNPKTIKEIDYLRNELAQIELILKVNDLNNKIVITGLTATSSHDLDDTPTATDYARVGIYPNTINTILNNGYIIKVNPFINYTLMLIIAIVMGFVIQRLDAKRSMITIGLSFLFLNAIVFTLFAIANLWIEEVGLSLALILPSMTIASIKFLKEESQKKYIKNAFTRYLSPGVIDQIIHNPDALELGGENRDITIFFSDVAKFSSISEKLTPPELVALLNEYLSAMTDIIINHGGTIDKYEGDAIMAFYGAPYSYEDHAKRACLAAIDMKKKLREMQEQWRKEGKDELYVRMGMNSGMAVVGNMGSSMRMDYTAMGDSVNLASRLEGANKSYDTLALISEATYKQVEDIVEARKLDVIRVVGKSEATQIYELLGRKGSVKDEMYEMLEFYNTGLEFFQNRQWKKALTSFKNGLKIIKDDGPCLKYIGRCEEYIKKAPSKKWDGVYSLKSK